MINITLEVNRKCNFNCSYCYITDKRDNEMSIETAISSIDWAVKKAKIEKQKEIDIDFLGGEPLLSIKLIKKIILYIEDKYEDFSFIYSITTNGSLIDENIVDYLISKSFFVKISLDGKMADNDKNRKYISGEGTFQNVVDKFPLLNRYQEQLNRGVQVNSVITTNNYMNYSSNLIFLVDVIGFRSIDLGINQGTVWSNQEIIGLRKEMKKALDFYLERNLSGTIFSWPFIEKMYQNYNGKQKINVFCCGAGIRSFYISWDGKIYMCPACMEKEYVIGHIGGDLEGDWYKTIISNKNIIDIDNYKCSSCTYKSFCATRGCFVKSHHENKTIHAPNSFSCSITKMVADLYLSEKTKIDEVMRERNEYKKYSYGR